MGREEVVNTSERQGPGYFLGLALVYIAVALSVALLLEASRLFYRQELQTINKRFETRSWLLWSPESMRRFSFPLIWQYHQDHEIPRQWWAWDYTLSWLIEHNHQPVMHKIIIFNHQLEDEPPPEAIETNPWMRPLLHHPLSRADLAEIVEFLAKSGAKMIVLDNDFPQYSTDDGKLSLAIHRASTGKASGRPVPVLMARTVNRRSSAGILQLEVPSTPSGLLDELSKLEPQSDVSAKYCGITGILQDEDQVVRKIALRLPGLTGKQNDSIVLKAIDSLGEPMPARVPDVVDIDFSAAPNSDLYPVRPLTYLLDPERRQDMSRRAAGAPGEPHRQDVTLSGAIVVLGDGVVDVFSTPFTNLGVNQMSGSEVLVHSLETVSRGSWPIRLEGWNSVVYYALITALGGAVLALWKRLQLFAFGLPAPTTRLRLVRTGCDLLCLLLTFCGAYAVACLLFAISGLIVPVFVPSVAMGVGALAALIWEREKEREETFRVKLEAANENVRLAKEKYELDIKRQEAEAKNREILMDRKRREEFVRRINHDLNAPVSVLNWTLSDLQEEGLNSASAKEKVNRLVKNSDKLCELIDQLVQTYDFDLNPDKTEIKEGTCSLARIVSDSLELQVPLAEMNCCKLILSSPPDSDLWVRANALEVSRVIDNLVRNAIKHNPQGTVIEVRLQSSRSFHELDVIDNGRGIDVADLSHIFEPGYRAREAAHDGQGLGLDIVKTLVEKMTGEICVESAKGRGTTFKVKLPKCAGPAEAYDDGEIERAQN